MLVSAALVFYGVVDICCTSLYISPTARSRDRNTRPACVGLARRDPASRLGMALDTDDQAWRRQ